MNAFEWTPMVWTHLAYFSVAALVTVYVGRVLQRYGKVVATNGEEKDAHIVDAFGRLLEVGFYLLSFGAINIALKYGGTADTSQAVIELVSTKVGVVLMILGILHLTMTLVFSEVRKSRNRDRWDLSSNKDGFDTSRRYERV